MGEIRPPTPVLPLLAVTSRHADAFDWASERFAAEFGAIQLASSRFRFDQTDYYEPTMGTELFKQFLAPVGLQDPGRLSHWKRLANQWEEDYRLGGRLPDPRPLNLDPGYLSEDKLVLASTKNHAHRLYVGEGIYAEVTLRFHRRQWQTCPWTYPDYGQPHYHAFFLECRQWLRGQLRGGSEC
jgi:hypothetical protein